LSEHASEVPVFKIQLGEIDKMPPALTQKSLIPRLVVAALKGGSGKTFITAGIAAALRRRGRALSVFKKGPDYIDAGWLGLAAGGECYNLDTYLMTYETVRRSFLRHSLLKDIAVVEGNRGLFDGFDVAGTYSTAQLAKLLKAPVILIVDATKMTRTAAALVLGCRNLDQELQLRAIVLNRVASDRHEAILRQSIEEVTSIPVIGSVRKLLLQNLPQRHLGLLPLHEHPQAMEFVEEAANVAERSIDLERVEEIASSAGHFPWELHPDLLDFGPEPVDRKMRIGILKDSAFQFYYPENLEALRRRVGPLVEISALEPTEFPELDGLYIGGGFPETNAERLAENEVFRTSLRKAVEGGLPVYAECGGLMYLSRSLCIDENTYPMVGVFPIDSALERRPQGLGYIRVRVEKQNPFYPQGVVLTGHEFHYSSVKDLDATFDHCAFRVLQGHGMDGVHDGICRFNAIGTYVHLHALGEPLWAEGILRSAAEYSASRQYSGNRYRP
jgi:cobyrinic acid a,c-diamide synthase